MLSLITMILLIDCDYSALQLSVACGKAISVKRLSVLRTFVFSVFFFDIR